MDKEAVRHANCSLFKGDRKNGGAIIGLADVARDLVNFVSNCPWHK